MAACVATTACSSGSTGGGGDVSDATSGGTEDGVADADHDVADPDAQSLPPAQVAALAQLRLAALHGSCSQVETQQALVRAYYRKYSAEWQQRNAAVDACLLAVSPPSCSSRGSCGGLRKASAVECDIVERTCDGDVLRSCTPDGTVSFDCAFEGLVCQDGGCVDPDAQECPAGLHPDPFVAGCVDGRPAACSDSRGYVLGQDCAAAGLKCGLSDYAITCIGTGASCESITLEGNLVVENPLFTDYRTVLACDGDVATACVGSHEHTMACSDINPDFTCQMYDGVPFCGLASECYGPKPAAVFPPCDNGKTLFCAAGIQLRADAAMLGLPPQFDLVCSPTR